MRIKSILLLSLFSGMIFAGCATVRDIHESFVESLRKPGETMQKSPADTAQYFSCSIEKQSMPVLFETEVIPYNVKPGKEINNRISYAFCPAPSAPKYAGEIIRTVKYKNHVIFRDKTAYDFKPGTWTVDASINVPDTAVPGEYIVETAIVLKGKLIMKSNTFQVKEK